MRNQLLQDIFDFERVLKVYLLFVILGNQNYCNFGNYLILFLVILVIPGNFGNCCNHIINGNMIDIENTTYGSKNPTPNTLVRSCMASQLAITAFVSVSCSKF